jgi:hypothetical protein
VGEVPGEAGLDLTSLRLDVYESRDGWWNPEHDVVFPPQDWEFLATGQAFVARSVKAAGVFWLAWAPRSRTRQHRRLLGCGRPRWLFAGRSGPRQTPPQRGQPGVRSGPAAGSGRRLATRTSSLKPLSSIYTSLPVTKPWRRPSLGRLPSALP